MSTRIERLITEYRALRHTNKGGAISFSMDIGELVEKLKKDPKSVKDLQSLIKFDPNSLIIIEDDDAE